MAEDSRGVLYPARLPTFRRIPAPEHLAHLVRWFWIPRWRLPAGRTSRQTVLSFPASNLVVEADAVTVSGPTTACNHQDLTGSGWAVGALLRPAGVAALGVAPAALRDRQEPFDAPELAAAVTAAMTDPDPVAADAAAAERFAEWLAAQPAPPSTALAANTLEDRVAADRQITRVTELAEALHLSVRQLQRLAHTYIGLPPLAVIRRYRLQEAAQRLREEPATPIAEVAADLGYADQAHLAADFRTLLGIRAGEYRSDSGTID